MNLSDPEVPLVLRRRRWESICVDSIGKRIDEARKARGLSFNDLDHKLNELLGRSDNTTGSASKLIGNKLKPSAKLTMALCEALQISADWMLFGRGPRDIDVVSAPVNSVHGYAAALAEAKAFAGPEYTQETWEKVSATVFSPPLQAVSARDLYELAKIASKSEH